MIKLFNKPEIENKSRFMCVSSTTEKFPLSNYDIFFTTYLDDKKNMIEKRRNELKSLSRNILFMNSRFLFSGSDIPSSLGLIYTSITSEHVTSKVSFPKCKYNSRRVKL